MFLPEGLKERVVAAENISLRASQIGDAGRKHVARAKSAFAVTGVLPQIPMAPGRGIARLVVIIGDPEPAIGENGAMGGGCAATVQHLSQPKFAAVNAGIFSGALFDSFYESGRLSRAHRTARIMAVYFEIEHEQNTGTRSFGV